ncbi:hypothetical protein FACS189475_07510 [Betaproteobacteria bacterium]|nr:hypothetical protein FACS189475_07510 [Betaproteobacteria bacterium]
MKKRDSSSDYILSLAKKFYGKKGSEPHVAELLCHYLKFHKDDINVRRIYGNELRILGRHKESLRELTGIFNKAQGRNKFDIAFIIAECIGNCESWRKAKKWYDIATNLGNELEIDKGWLWVLKGVNLARLGEFQEAIACYKTALDKTDVDKDEVFFNLGIAYRSLREYDEAIKCFQQALDIQPKFSGAKKALSGIMKISHTIAIIEQYSAEVVIEATEPGRQFRHGA